MSAYTVIVQNQYPSHRLGEVTAGLQFFRSIGSTIGLAVFGTILNNQFAASMKATLPAGLQKYQAIVPLDNPQVLLSPSSSKAIHFMFVSKLGAQGERLFAAFMHAVRVSLDTALSDLFLIGALVGVVALVVVLFLREDPLRRTHAIDPESGEEDSEAAFTPEPAPQPE
jgi:hypothetical protein